MREEDSAEVVLTPLLILLVAIVMGLAAVLVLAGKMGVAEWIAVLWMTFAAVGLRVMFTLLPRPDGGDETIAAYPRLGTHGCPWEMGGLPDCNGPGADSTTKQRGW